MSIYMEAFVRFVDEGYPVEVAEREAYYLCEELFDPEGLDARSMGCTEEERREQLELALSAA